MPTTVAAADSEGGVGGGAAVGAGVGATPAGTRVALVIGNSDYRAAPALTNPAADAGRIGAALAQLGFDLGDGPLLDTDQRRLREALRRFRDRSREADLAVLYYAGHGIQADGINYLIPVDAQLDDAADLDLESIALGAVLDQMRASVNLVILDACRDNPFAGRLRATGDASGRRLGLSAGLAGIDSTRLGQGSLIAMAAAPGKVALDGPSDGNSPYASALLRHLATPGLDVGALFRRVREDVEQATQGRQRPEAIDRLPARPVTLALPSATMDPPAPAAVPMPQPPAAITSPIGAASVAATTATGSELRLSGPPRSGPASADLPAGDPAAGGPPAPGTVPVTIGAVLRDCPVCPELIVIPAGGFAMGSPVSEVGRDADEGPQHPVRIGAPLAFGKFEVTFEEWEACVEDGGCRDWSPPDEGWGRLGRPVIHVSWHDAQSYLAWLRARTGLGFRLATESEWEYAARAGTTGARPWGADAGVACTHANVHDLSAAQAGGMPLLPHPCDDGYPGTAPVGALRPNRFGLHDMLGNVAEWVEDCADSGYDGAPPQGSPQDGRARLDPACTARRLRGGAWSSAAQGVRSAFRDSRPPDTRLPDLGFRVVRPF